MNSSRVSTSVCVFFAVLLCALTPYLAAAAETREIIVHGSDSMYWISRFERAERTETFYTLIQSRPIGPSDQWITIAKLSQRVISLSNSGTQLAALLDNGDWMLLWDGGSSNGPRPAHSLKHIHTAFAPDPL